MDKVKPIRLNYKDEEYILEYSREAIVEAEENGFKIAEVDEKPLTGVSNLFYYAFRKNHPDMTKDETDTILTALGGLKGKEIERLGQLYNIPLETVVSIDETPRKKSSATISL